MFRRIKLAYVPLVVSVVLVISGLVWAVGSNRGDNKTSTLPAATTSPKPIPSVSAPVDPDASPTQAFKVRLDSRVQAFVAAYFSVSYPEGATHGEAVSKSADASAQAIKPYVSEHFLETAPLGYEMFGSSAAAESLVQAEASIKAEPVTGLTDSRITATRISGTVMVHYSKTDQNGSLDLGVKPQSLTLVKRGTTWFVDSAPLT